MREESVRPGDVLGGRWELVEEIASGSLATIYSARAASQALEGPATYAVKVLHRRWEYWDHARELLAREALVGRSVMHPHLVTVLEEQLDEAPYHLVMPLIEGRSLERVFERRAPLAIPTLLWIVRQTAEALRALDEAGWIHGDVKPSNVLWSPQGHVTLIDLGFARRPREENSALDRCVMGAVGYIAPELLLSIGGADIRSDIYSLGVLLFQGLTGRTPVAAGSLEELAAAHRRGIRFDMGRLAPHAPGSLQDLVHRMTAQQPLRRPATPEDLIAELVDLEIEYFGQHSF